MSPSGYAMISHSLYQVRDKVDSFEPFVILYLFSVAHSLDPWLERV